MKTLFRIIGKIVKFVFILALVVIIAGVAFILGTQKGGSSDRYVPVETQRPTYPTVTVAPTTEPEKTETATEEQPSVDPEPSENTDPVENTEAVEDVDFRAWVDTYEEFMFRYADFLEKYIKEGSPITMLADYSKIMLEYAEFMEQTDRVDTDNLSSVDLAYYSAAQTRVLERLSRLD